MHLRLRITLVNEGKEVGLLRHAYGMLGWKATYSNVNGLLVEDATSGPFVAPPQRAISTADILRMRKRQTHSFDEEILVRARGPYGEGEGTNKVLPAAFDVSIQLYLATSVLDDAHMAQARSLAKGLKLLSEPILTRPFTVRVRPPARVPPC